MITPLMCYTASDGKMFQDINEAMNYEKLAIECGAITKLVEGISCVDDNPEAAEQALKKFKELGKKTFQERDYWQFRECQYGQMDGTIYRLLSDYSSTYNCLWLLYRRLSQIKPSQNSVLSTKGHLYPDGEYVHINRTEQYWAYQQDQDDEESYMSGNFRTDNNDRFKVIDYDGCYELPVKVIEALKELDYDTSEIASKLARVTN